MKKLLMPLLAMFAVVTLYSCSDKDKTPAPPKPSEVVKGTYDAANLTLSVEGTALEGAKVTVETASETAVNITLEKAIFGYDKVVAAAIPVSTTKAEATATYYIKGSHKVDNLTLTFDGSITGGKMAMTVTQAYEAPFIGALVPTVGTPAPNYDPKSACMHIDFTTTKEKVMFMGMEQDPKAIAPLLQLVLGAGYIAPELQSVTFTANGTYTVKTKAELPFPIVGKYTYKKDVVSLELPAAVIAMLKELAPTMPEMKSLDFMFKADGTQNIFYVNKEMMLPYFALIQGLLPTPPTGDGMTDLIVGVIGELKVIMTESTKFDMGLNLTKK